MKSELPKVLHTVCGIPMADHAGRAMRQAGVSRPIVVYGHGGEDVKGVLGEGSNMLSKQNSLARRTQRCKQCLSWRVTAARYSLVPGMLP